MLRIEGLEIERPSFRLGPLSFEVGRGDYFVLLGPSGAGKTTLLEWIAGFVRAKAGEVFMEDRALTRVPPGERGVAIVYQDSALFPHLTVRENLAFGPQMEGWEPAKTEARVRELAGLLRISHRLDSLSKKISGGEQRRVALGRAIAAGRSVLLLDEPLEGLDPDLRRDLRHELASLHRQLGLTVVHVTHHLGEARSLATRVGILLDGRLQQIGAPEEVFAHPATAEVARFLTISNFVIGEADPGAGGIRVNGGTLLPAPVRAAGKVRARVSGLGLLISERNECLRATLRGIERPESGGAFAVAALSSDPAAPRLEIPLPEPSLARDLVPGGDIWIDFSFAKWEIY